MIDDSESLYFKTECSTTEIDWKNVPISHAIYKMYYIAVSDLSMVFVAMPSGDAINLIFAFGHVHCELVVINGLSRPAACAHAHEQRRQQSQRTP